MRAEVKRNTSIITEEKPSALFFDTFGIDYTANTTSLLEQLTPSTMTSRAGGNGGDPDFLLGDMDLYFDGSAGDDDQVGVDDGDDANNNNNEDDNLAGALDDDFAFGDDAGLDGDEDNNNSSFNSSSNNNSNNPGSRGNNDNDFPRPGNSGNNSFYSIGTSSLLSSQTSSSLDAEFPKRPWHSDANDKGARQSMILEIARLLKSRKKTQPSNEWLQQLPHKARKLEERLYRAAPSMSAYQDVTTLKNRLRKVAQVIATQYTTAKTRNPFTQRRDSTTSSVTSAASSLQSSNSQQSYQNRESFTSHTSMESVNSLNLRMGGMSAVSAVPSQLGAGGGERGVPNPRNQSLKSIPEELFSSLGGGPSRVLPQAVGESAATHRLQMQQQQQGNNAPAGAPQNKTNSQSLLEQQKAINEKLRMEIQENIRKQNELFRQLQEKQNSGPQQLSGNAPSPMPQQQKAGAPVAQPLQLQRGNSNGVNPMGMQQGNGPMSMAPQGAAGAQQNAMAPGPGNMSFGMAPGGNMLASAPGNMQRQQMNGGQGMGMQQQQQGQSGMSGFPYAAQLTAAAALMNNPNAPPAARLQAAQMHAVLIQQQQLHQKQNSMNGQNPMNPMQMQQQNGQFGQQGPQQGMQPQGQQTQFTQQQYMNKMLHRGPPVLPGGINGAPVPPGVHMSPPTPSPATNGAMPPPPVMSKPNDQPHMNSMAADSLSPGSFNW